MDKETAQRIFEKKRTAFKNYCLGRDFHDVLRAMTFAQDYHKGYRKDGVTPEFQHQLEIGLYATTLKGLSREDESVLLQLIMLHDVVEDYEVSLMEIEQRFGPVIAHGVGCLSKIIDGVKKDMQVYMNEQTKYPLVALAKGCDRVQNVQSMRGVFSNSKQQNYSHEVRHFFMPMLKRARDLAPQYRQALNNVKHMLESQVQWVEYMQEELKAQQAAFSLERNSLIETEAVLTPETSTSEYSETQLSM